MQSHQDIKQKSTLWFQILIAAKVQIATRTDEELSDREVQKYSIFIKGAARSNDCDIRWLMAAILLICKSKASPVNTVGNTVAALALSSDTQNNLAFQQPDIWW